MHANTSPVYRAQLELDSLLLSCLDKELLTVSGRGFVVFTQWVVSLTFYYLCLFVFYWFDIFMVLKIFRSIFLLDGVIG